MRRRFPKPWLALSTMLLTATLAVPASADDAAAPEPIVTCDSKFAIPFQVEAQAGRQTEVRLYVSENLGRDWKLYSRAVAPLDNFDFQAAGEGEYWFAVRTLDDAGREVPVEPLAAELRVVVDKTPPLLELTTETKPDGEIAVRWKVDDRHIAADTLKLSYRSRAGNGPYQAVEAAKTKRHLDENSASGESSWRPTPNSADFVLRAEVRDAADNLVVREVAVNLGSAASPLAAPVDSAPVNPATPQALPIPGMVATPAVAAPAPAAPQTVAPPMAVRDPTKPMMVNSTSFELDYDLARAEGVAKVEVWGTRNDGRNWVQLGLDDDRRSPCAVNVETEGMYGFTIVVEETGGLKGRTPQPGDVPEMRVGVDLSVPHVRLTTAEPDAEGRPCFMKINWEATDDHLGPQAVTLSCSAAPQGPWTPLAQGIASTGGHLCEFDPQGPDNAYLKIDVRDDAGNVGTFTTTAAVPIEKRQVQFSFAGAGKKEASQPKPKWYHVLR